MWTVCEQYVAGEIHARTFADQWVAGSYRRGAYLTIESQKKWIALRALRKANGAPIVQKTINRIAEIVKSTPT